MCVLVLATSWPNPNVPDVRNGDKVVHALLYGILGFLAWRAVAPPPDVSPRERMSRIALVVAAASAFGWADEWHQQFIPGRSRSAADWQVDTLGAMLGAVLGAAVGVTAGTHHREQPS